MAYNMTAFKALYVLRRMCIPYLLNGILCRYLSISVDLWYNISRKFFGNFSLEDLCRLWAQGTKEYNHYFIKIYVTVYSSLCLFCEIGNPNDFFCINIYNCYILFYRRFFISLVNEQYQCAIFLL